MLTDQSSVFPVVERKFHVNVDLQRIHGESHGLRPVVTETVVYYPGLRIKSFSGKPNLTKKAVQNMCNLLV